MWDCECHLICEVWRTHSRSKASFWKTAFVSDTAAVNADDTETVTANAVSRYCINGKAALVNGARKLSNSTSWLLIFLVVPFNKIPLSFKDLITFIIFFISLFVSVIPGSLNLFLIAEKVSKIVTKVFLFFQISYALFTAGTIFLLNLISQQDWFFASLLDLSLVLAVYLNLLILTL